MPSVLIQESCYASTSCSSSSSQSSSSSPPAKRCPAFAAWPTQEDGDRQLMSPTRRLAAEQRAARHSTEAAALRSEHDR